MEAFFRQKIPESSCAMKETAKIDILITSKNGDRKIMQSIRIMNRPPTRIKGISSASLDEHLTHNYGKDLSWSQLTMSQEFKRSSKCWTNSTTYLFL